VNTPFRFFDAGRLTCPTGIAAATLREFRIAVEGAELAVLHHHLRETPLRHTFAVWGYPNDFAIWTANALEERALAERLAVLDPFHERDLEVLRERVLEAVEEMERVVSGTRPVPSGQEFSFCGSVAVEFPLGIEARTVAELVEALEHVPASSLYLHLYEARLRTPDGSDDVSRWLCDVGESEAAKRLRDLDIYLLALEECRSVILRLIAGEAEG
jgi:Family of unknown function (DUF5752)